KKIDEALPFPEAMHQTIELITDLVVQEAEKLAMQDTLLTVEGIQDIVEIKLMETGHHDVARDYIIYRDEHKKLRIDSPRAIKILRRDGLSFVRFNPMKIASALERGFRDTLKITGPTPEAVIESVNQLTNKVIEYVMHTAADGAIVSIEMILDAIEKELMAEGYYEVSKDFILYRAERARLREKAKERGEEPAVEIEEEELEHYFTVIRKEGSSYKLTKGQLKRKLSHAAKNYPELLPIDDLVEHTIANFYDGIKDHEVDLATIMAARAKVELEPNYTYVAANLLLDVLYRETMGIEAVHPHLPKLYKEYFKEYFRKGVSLEHLDPTLLSFDLDVLAEALEIDRDMQFTYLGLQTLYDRYFIHHEQRRLETPQIFWM
ncbi:MAG: ribonucleoside-diphosphate reductase subunit alpha, partial [Chlamydiia bacterium]|nr:ribonucleoside-diphosphate reductase subunit alpha [Chlamydiia bacterium]